MAYPKFLKENNEAPITYRVLLSPASGIELHSISGEMHYREVNSQAAISSWEAEREWGLFVDCDKSEMVEAFIQCENYLGDKRINIKKLL